ncbi:tetratricopeptide repeat protein [Erythrobacter sp. EC-HK427]|uniref:tetratricopeptide repeat protein n=1 Tax=Erythrobacter sp. EC-HK427 TaxID=2038396 RepID=UPI00125BA5F0|nr:tetratricopeptide repeat protein [Erythrobacter sp. EC-HK427]VVT18269.1 conserved hypothetical protein [Erythrobacter sp. EC-HK427]
MSWAIAIALALLAMGTAIALYKLPRAVWAGLAASLVFGLAGYAMQANPDLPSAPKAPEESRVNLEEYDVVAQRREFIADDERSRADFLVTADGMARRGQFDDAVTFLNGVTTANPQDFEAWLALGNALVEHADGALTQPAQYAYRNAASLRPDHPGPGYFMGVALIRQGRFPEARELWAQALAIAPEDAAGREGLVERLNRIDAMLAMVAQAQAMEAANAAAEGEQTAPATTATAAPEAPANGQ